MADAAAAVLDEIGVIDVLVNNAGVVRGNRYFWETDLERDTKFTIDVNTLAPMYVAHEFLPAMVAALGECRMLNLASAAGFTPNPRMAVYAASKWAVIGWSDSVRLELKQAGHDHVKVTTVCPYYVHTGMFDGANSAPLLPILDPADVVDEAWTAMLAGRPFVVLPKTVMLSEMLKGVVPTGVRDFIADHIIGVYHTMDDFTGRASPPAEIHRRNQGRSRITAIVLANTVDKRVARHCRTFRPLAPATLLADAGIAPQRSVRVHWRCRARSRSRSGTPEACSSVGRPG